MIDKNYNTIYLNEETNFKKHIYLIHIENHFNVILSMASFYNKSYFCDYCKKAYDNQKEHNCAVICKACKRRNCQYINVNQCKDCKLNPRNDDCSEIYLTKECPLLKKCKECGEIKSFKNHVCGVSNKWCMNCKLSVDILTESERNNKKEKEPKKPKFEGYIFFDFECYQNDNESDEKYGEHVVNLAMACKICSKCLDLQPKDRCSECLKKYKFFNIDDYCTWALSQQNTIQLAHNLKGKLFFISF